jgi:hypothetical protein
MSQHYSAAPGSTASCNIYIRRANQALRVRPESKGKTPSKERTQPREIRTDLEDHSAFTFKLLTRSSKHHVSETVHRKPKSGLSDNCLLI